MRRSQAEWFFEEHKNTKIGFKVRETLYSGKSEYQEIKVLDTFDWGRVLLLDDTIMITEKDEFFYHETITHLPIFLLNNKKVNRVLVFGGGDGGTVRELLKYPEIKEIKLVEIDQKVIEVSKKFLPFTSEKLEHPNVEIITQDANDFLKEKLDQEKFDLVISDSSDPEGIAKIFIQEDFYKKVKKILKEEGIFIQQSSSALSQKDEFDLTRINLKKVFPQIEYAWSLVPTYPGALWTFSLASIKYNFEKVDFNRKEGTEFELDCKFWKPDLVKALLSKPKILDL